MKISKKSQYGLRALFRLAEKNQNLSVRQISEKEAISPDYLEKIFFDLEKAKIIKAKRGAGGGYSLNKKPDDITLKDILEVLESTLDLVECIDSDCSRKEICPTASVWKIVDEAIKEKLESITLKDLIKKYE